MKKTPRDIAILHMCTQNDDQMMYDSWDIVRDERTDRRTDGQKKWHIEVGAPPKNLLMFLVLQFINLSFISLFQSLITNVFMTFAATILVKIYETNMSVSVK